LCPDNFFSWVTKSSSRPLLSKTSAGNHTV
jgi:hypothetical protein